MGKVRLRERHGEKASGPWHFCSDFRFSVKTYCRSSHVSVSRDKAVRLACLVRRLVKSPYDCFTRPFFLAKKYVPLGSLVVLLVSRSLSRLSTRLVVHNQTGYTHVRRSCLDVLALTPHIHALQRRVPLHPSPHRRPCWRGGGRAPRRRRRFQPCPWLHP